MSTLIAEPSAINERGDRQVGKTSESCTGPPRIPADARTRPPSRPPPQHRTFAIDKPNQARSVRSRIHLADSKHGKRMLCSGHFPPNVTLWNPAYHLSPPLRASRESTRPQDPITPGNQHTTQYVTHTIEDRSKGFSGNQDSGHATESHQGHLALAHPGSHGIHGLPSGVHRGISRHPTHLRPSAHVGTMHPRRNPHHLTLQPGRGSMRAGYGRLDGRRDG